MQDRRFRFGWPLLLLLLLSGCGWWSGEEQEEPQNGQVNLEEFQRAGEKPSDQNPDQATRQTGETLRLKLEKNDRFPLMKTVEQSLLQASPQGATEWRSKLELLLSIVVEDVRQERIRLGVHYHRVQYRHNLDGDQVEFDSSRNSADAQAIPPAARPYAGLVGNGFSFWLDADNTIIKLVDFKEFLNRCVDGLPGDQRQKVLSATSEETGLANFVDDSIGLLPYREQDALRVGSTWSRQRRMAQPLPVQLKTDYTLTKLTEEVAQIDILGDITPVSKADSRVHQTSGVAAAGQKRDVELEVRGGHSFGHCTIDRATGLPLNSQVERYINMVAHMPDGRQVEQRKQVVTTIRAFPQQGSSQEDSKQGGGSQSPRRISPPDGPDKPQPISRQPAGSGRR